MSNTTAAAAPRNTLKHTDIAALTVAFYDGGLAAACALHPDIAPADMERKLRKAGIMKASVDDHAVIAEIAEMVKLTTHPHVTAEHVIADMKAIVAAHDAKLAKK